MQPDFFPDIALTILAIDLLRYLLGAGLVWLAVNVVLQRRLARRRILDARPRPGQLAHELTYSASTVLIFAANGGMLWLMTADGWVRIYDDVARYGWAWWWASLALIVVAHDTWFYWTHRLLHHKRWFAAVHGRHHASAQPTPWAAYSFHPIEALLQAVFLPLYVALVPTHVAVVGLFLVHMILRNAIGHCSHELLPWAWTRHGALRWITPVTHHHFHHARNRGNYGLYFSWWDRWCGTEDAAYLAYGDAHFAGAGKHRGIRMRAGLRLASTALAALLSAVLAARLVAPVRAQSSVPVDPAALLGEWWTPGFNARVRIELCGDAVCGHIVWAWDEQPKDIADKRPLVGRKVIDGMRGDGGVRWAGGRLYNPEDGRDYKGSVQLQSPSRLFVEGCVLMLCRQQVWRRADLARCPPVAPA